MRKAKEFKTIADLGFKKADGNYLLKAFGSVQRIIFEGRYAVYLGSEQHHYAGDDRKAKSLTRIKTEALKDRIIANDLVRYDLGELFRIGQLYKSLGYRGCTTSFVDFQAIFNPSGHGFIGNPFAEANENYENLNPLTPEECAKLRMAIAARLTPEECAVVMLELSGHLGMAFDALDRKIASALCISEEEARKIKDSARSKLRSRNPLPLLPISDDRIMPNFS